jgi:hypothetical protein
LEESPMKDLNSHGHDEGLEEHGEDVGGLDSLGHDEGLGGHDEDAAGDLRPKTPERTTRSPGPSPSPGLADAASGLATGNELGIASERTSHNDQNRADGFTFPRKSTPMGPETTTTNGNDDTSPDTLTSANAPDLDSNAPIIEKITGQDTNKQSSETEQAVSDGDLPPPPSEDDQQHFRSIIAGVTEDPVMSMAEIAEPEVTKPEDLPPAPSAEDQQHFRSIITGVAEEPIKSETETAEPGTLEQEVTEQEITEPESIEPELLPAVASPEDQQHFRSVITGIAEEPIKPEAEAMDQDITEPENEIADHHTIKSASQTTDDEPITVPAAIKQQTSTSAVAPPIEEEKEGENPGPSGNKDRPTTPSADRQHHMRAILAGVIDDGTTEPKSPETDATVPSTDSEEPSLTPPFVTPMTFMDDVEPTYPETNETIHATSTRTTKTTIDETKPLEAQDSTSL